MSKDLVERLYAMEGPPNFVSMFSEAASRIKALEAKLASKDVVGGAAQGEQDSIDSDAFWHVLATWANSRDNHGDVRSARAEKAEDAVLAYINNWRNGAALSRPNAPVLQGEREAFEVWYLKVLGGLYSNLQQKDDGTYRFNHTAGLWDAWQARASSAAQIQEQQHQDHLAEPAEQTDTRVSVSYPGWQTPPRVGGYWRDYPDGWRTDYWNGSAWLYCSPGGDKCAQQSLTWKFLNAAPLQSADKGKP